MHVVACWCSRGPCRAQQQQPGGIPSAQAAACTCPEVQARLTGRALPAQAPAAPAAPAVQGRARRGDHHPPAVQPPVHAAGQAAAAVQGAACAHCSLGSSLAVPQQTCTLPAVHWGCPTSRSAASLGMPGARWAQDVTRWLTVAAWPQGHVLYYGQADLADKWFAQLGYPLPYKIALADWVLDLSSADVATSERRAPLPLQSSQPSATAARSVLARTRPGCQGAGWAAGSASLLPLCGASTPLSATPAPSRHSRPDQVLPRGRDGEASRLHLIRCSEGFLARHPLDGYDPRRDASQDKQLALLKDRPSPSVGPPLGAGLADAQAWMRCLVPQSCAAASVAASATAASVPGQERMSSRSEATVRCAGHRRRQQRQLWLGRLAAPAGHAGHGPGDGVPRAVPAALCALLTRLGPWQGQHRRHPQGASAPGTSAVPALELRTLLQGALSKEDPAEQTASESQWGASYLTQLRILMTRCALLPARPPSMVLPAGRPAAAAHAAWALRTLCACEGPGTVLCCMHCVMPWDPAGSPSCWAACLPFEALHAAQVHPHAALPDAERPGLRALPHRGRPGRAVLAAPRAARHDRRRDRHPGCAALCPAALGHPRVATLLS